MKNIDKLLEEMKKNKTDFPLMCHCCPAQKYCQSLDETDTRKCGEIFADWANMEVVDENKFQYWR
jgi:hypothetical protein